MTAESWALFTEWAKIVGALGAFGFGTYQYVRTQKWKRREFIAAQIKDLEADKQIQVVLTILDWSDRLVAIPSQLEDRPPIVFISESLLCASLLPHSSTGSYSTEEALIRDCFDRFLDGLDRLQTFIVAELISIDELRPYIDYWLKSMSGQTQQHPPEFYVLLHNYIQVYGFTRVAQLIESLGYRAAAPHVELEAAIQRILAQRPPIKPREWSTE
jgi:hypothetical protein